MLSILVKPSNLFELYWRMGASTFLGSGEESGWGACEDKSTLFTTICADEFERGGGEDSCAVLGWGSDPPLSAFLSLEAELKSM